jgi:hypothetical protein
MIEKIPASLIHSKPAGAWLKEMCLVALAGLVGLVMLYLVVSETLFYIDNPDIKRGDIKFADPELHLAGRILGWEEAP